MYDFSRAFVVILEMPQKLKNLSKLQQASSDKHSLTQRNNQNNTPCK